MTTDDDFDRRSRPTWSPVRPSSRIACSGLRAPNSRPHDGVAPGSPWLAPWRSPNMTRNSRLMLLEAARSHRGGDRRRLLRVDGRATEPRAGRLGGAIGTWILGDAILTELLGGAGPELVHCCSEGARVVRNRGMTEARGGHTATLLSDGKVLVAGGWISSNPGMSANSAELYDPSSGTWSATGACTRAATARPRRSCTNGRVLVAGGWRTAASHRTPNCTTRSAEPGLPPRSPSSRPGKVRPPRCFQMARCSLWVATATTNAELYDPISGTGTVTGANRHKSLYATGTLLSDGRLLVAGGPPNRRTRDAYGRAVRPEQRVLDRHWKHGPRRTEHTATLLTDGRVLVAGRQCRPRPKAIGLRRTVRPDQRVLDGHWEHGHGPRRRLLDGAARWQGARGRRFPQRRHRCVGFRGDLRSGTGTWTAAPNMDASRAGHTATLLPDGMVLVAGVSVIDGTEPRWPPAELYDPGVGN